MTRPALELLNEALDGAVVCDIGQVCPIGKRALDQAVRAGELATWRGHWHPVPGAPFGIGPLKTCWGRPEHRDCWDGFSLRSSAEAV